MTQAFIFIGPSGSGKGTQAQNLIEKLSKRGDSPCYIETGATFREFITGEKPLQKRSREFYKEGKRQPDFLAVYMWANELVRRFSGEQSVIFDGTPRSLYEAYMLDTALSFLHTEKVFVISLALPHKILMERLLKRGRGDDDPYGIEKRLAWFQNDVVPAIEYYKKHPTHTFIEIDGSRSVNEVWSDLEVRLI
ncbi:MAG: nucleoside monophosphate kinase [Candidatus Paceibacterota bacterium]